jgi:hypothetical protein
VTKAPCKFICLFAVGLLTSCVVFTDHSFSGKMRIDQKSHWIKLTGDDLARTDEDKAVHPGDIPSGTIRSILKQAGLTEEQFRNL